MPREEKNHLNFTTLFFIPKSPLFAEPRHFRIGSNKLDPKKLEGALVDLTLNPEKCAQMGQNSKLFISQHYTFDNFIKNIIDGLQLQMKN